MRILESRFPINTSYPLERLGRPEDLVFFDIETTGLSHRKSQLYLIGTTTLHREKAGEWVFVLRQYFAETLTDEREILEAFFATLTDHSVLIDYNGHTFDLPYLNACAEAYHIASPLEKLTEIDLLKDVRKLAKPLNLADCKLRTVEEFLGIRRLDPFTGGELIEQYHEFQKTGDEALFQNLILHNREDLVYLPPVLDLLLLEELPSLAVSKLSYRLEWDEAKASVPSEDESGSRNACGSNDPAAGGTASYESVLVLKGRLSAPLPFPVHLSGIDCEYCCDGEAFALRVKGFTGTLRHYYPDFKNYYYLPAEGIAVHKRIAEFMNPADRRKATREEACIARTGLFFPQKTEAVTPAFRESSRSKESCFEYSDALTAEQLTAYLADTLSSLLTGRR